MITGARPIDAQSNIFQGLTACHLLVKGHFVSVQNSLIMPAIFCLPLNKEVYFVKNVFTS